ncbi:GATA zinc finger domain-containing protein 14 isoform X2 [Megalobrama amblycephala]|uniref:GATA zinc finger domain-containing protein 14 isoform X2 n=1 Tax=Megalobrama amblycephala TaxID=75352 RepID=UPI002014555F|nr:GATA zinc finger domain-containing protein 14 isoform X2 [Megalobrama amblycephala]
MNILLLHPVVVFTLISLPLAAVCLDPVPIQFEKTPVLVASGKDAIFTVQTVSDVSLIRWTDSGGTTLAMWVNGNPVVISILQYQGRMSVTATQLKITNSQLRDSGNYSVSVEPSTTTGLGVNTRSVQLKVFDAVNGVSLSLPALPLEGGNVSLSCSWSAGSEVSVVWGKGGVALSSDTRITISAGSLIIKSARRDDAGEYTCTVSNAVSAQTAKATLNGPDAPQLTKTSSECVGGGDATVGQTVRLTCTSTSLPPASFSWELNGQPVTAGQSGSGVLNLQIFSTNQSGTYACTARNDITGGASKQQIDLAIVGTCLSGGAVAGIVVACVVALIIIIIVIIVLLRQRNVDRRLKDAIGLQKTNQNEGTIIANRALVNENHPDPTLHSSLPQNFTAIPNNNNGNVDTMPQNIPSSSNPLHHNGHLNTDVFHHHFSTLPDNGHQNNNSYPSNDPQRSFPQPVQHNPNILIQTGSSQPGALAHTVHVNLNTLPRTDQLNNAQPQTVHVNLNTYPPEANQPSQANRQHADQRESALQGQHTNANHQNLSQTGFMNSESLSLGNQTQTMLNNASTNRSRQPNSLIQTGRSHPTNQTNANRRTANSRSSAEERTRHSNPVRTNNRLNDTHTSTHLQQMPWDRLQGTPAYPNREVDSSDSSGSSEWRPRSPQRNAQRGRSGRRSQEIEPASRTIQAPSASQRGDLQRPISPNMLNQSQMNPNVQRQVIQQSISTQPQTQTTVPQIQTSPGQNPIHIGPPLGTTTSQSHPQTQTATRPHQTVAQPSIPLTQAALQQHTTQTDNPFTNLIQQTQAALQNPGPSQPIQQLNKAGQRPPTPPPVLRPAEFQALPRERVQQARNIQPVKVQHRHRPPNMQRQTRVWHTSPQRLPGMHPMHGHPMHMQQVQRGRPRR